MTTRVWIVSLVALLVASTSATARAQFDFPARAASGGITVAGIGTVKGVPDRAKIDVRMQGKAEITDDALVKYHASHRRLTEALDKLKLENLHVSERAVTLASGGGNANMMMMMNGMGGGQSETAPTEISGILRIELTNLENMPKDDVWKLIGKVLDAIRDAGGTIGPSPAEMQMARWYGRMQTNTMVKFVLSDLKPLREQSYELAVADARARGDRLARLSGIKLAGVAAVTETQIPGDGPDQNRNPYFWNFNDTGSAPHERDEIVVDSLTEIPVTVHLMVRFDIAEGSAKPPGGTAAPADAGTKPAEVSAKDAAVKEVSTQ